MENKKPISVKPSFYAVNFQPLKEIALKYGYNLVLHGSLNRDMDIIAIPWSDELGVVPHMIIDMADYLGGRMIRESEEEQEEFRRKKHGRSWYGINIYRSGDVNYEYDPEYYIDISVTPAIKY